MFGERIWIEAAGRGDDDDWQRWAMFLLSIKGKGHEPADLSLAHPARRAEGARGRAARRSAARARRDGQHGLGHREDDPAALRRAEAGREAAHETRAFFEQDLERRLGAPPQPPPPAEGAKIRYQVMSTVPENWIPMIPVHVPGDNREIQLQRAAMPRIMDGDPDRIRRPVRPAHVAACAPASTARPPAATSSTRKKCRAPASGVTDRFQRTRWRDGRVLVWLGVRKQTGRGEGSSGLAFDRIVDIKPSE